MLHATGMSFTELCWFLQQPESGEAHDKIILKTLARIRISVVHLWVIAMSFFISFETYFAANTGRWWRHDDIIARAFVQKCLLDGGCALSSKSELVINPSFPNAKQQQQK